MIWTTQFGYEPATWITRVHMEAGNGTRERIVIIEGKDILKVDPAVRNEV
jgi:hypothetical protein